MILLGEWPHIGNGKTAPKKLWGGPAGSGHGKGPGPSLPSLPSGRGMSGQDRCMA
jgi:hypothetical protein